jgi:hypothetical protein
VVLDLSSIKHSGGSVMKRNAYIAFAVVAVLTTFAFFNSHVSRAEQPGRFGLRGDFEVTIEDGPTAQSGAVKIAGILTLAVFPSGDFVGKLTPADGQSSVVFGNLVVDNPQAVRVVGQVNERAYNVMLELGEGRFISGVGTSLDIVTKKGDSVGFLAGPAVGPNPGDRGDWSSGSQSGYVIKQGLSYQQY